MLLTNPFSILAGTISPIFMQSFVILMVTMIIVGTLLDIIHKKVIEDNIEPKPKSGQQEFLENLINKYL